MASKIDGIVMTAPLPEIALLAQGFAMCAHRNQRRKFDASYMVHPIRAARIVAEYTDDANLPAAAMMHDVLEDTDVTAEEMRRVFVAPDRDSRFNWYTPARKCSEYPVQLHPGQTVHHGTPEGRLKLISCRAR